MNSFITQPQERHNVQDMKKMEHLDDLNCGIEFEDGRRTALKET